MIVTFPSSTMHDLDDASRKMAVASSRPVSKCDESDPVIQNEKNLNRD
jgi:hypothetical protein